jgi:2-oxoglutarate ferredoxin oxidoreductase subunit alpha
VGWGGTYGALRQAAETLRAEGEAVSHLHLRYLNPLQKNVGEILRAFRRVIVCEMNLGQLRMILRHRFLVDAAGLNKVQGQPFKVREIADAARAALRGSAARESRV